MRPHKCRAMHRRDHYCGLRRTALIIRSDDHVTDAAINDGKPTIIATNLVHTISSSAWRNGVLGKRPTSSAYRNPAKSIATASATSNDGESAPLPLDCACRVPPTQLRATIDTGFCSSGEVHGSHARQRGPRSNTRKLFDDRCRGKNSCSVRLTLSPVPSSVINHSASLPKSLRSSSRDIPVFTRDQFGTRLEGPTGRPDSPGQLQPRRQLTKGPTIQIGSVSVSQHAITVGHARTAALYAWSDNATVLAAGSVVQVFGEVGLRRLVRQCRDPTHPEVAQGALYTSQVV